MKYGAKLTGSIKQALSGLQGYDIMALELIQNATDAGAEEIIFDICDDGLRILNNKQFTSCGLNEEGLCGFGDPMCDFHAISQFASANKSSDSKYIGRFGIGFVSVYQITDEPVICSNGKKVKLNPLNEEADVSDMEEKIDETYFYLPWVRTYTGLREALAKSPVKESICEDVLEGIEKVGKKCLFFLKGMKSIQVLRNGKFIKSFSLKRQGNTISITTKCGKSDAPSRDKYCIFEGKIDSSDLENKYRHLKESKRKNDIQVAIALKDIEKFKTQGLIFAYLPTEQKTNMPIHINADFFPESNRKKIILSGEDYEKYWNFALLEGAANLIAENLLSLRDELKHKAFWDLLHSIYYNNEENFACFREKIEEVTKQIPCVFTEREEWVLPSEALSVDNDEINSNKQKVLSKLGFKIVHPDISNRVDFLRITPLDIHSFVEMLESKGNFKKHTELLNKIHSIANSLCKDIDSENEIIKRFIEVKIIPYGKELLSIKSMHRLPSAIEKENLPSIISDLRIVDKKFKKHANLYRLFCKLDFSNLGSELERRIVDSDAAKEHIGASEAKIKKFYKFLSNYPAAKDGEGWKDIPLFYCKGTFYSINDSVKLPSEFTDPFDKFNIIDKKLASADIASFFKKAFGLKEQSAKEYLIEKFEQDFDGYESISVELYEKILVELLNNFGRIERNVEGIRNLLKEMTLVWTEDNKLEKASECYFKKPFLIDLLGDEKKLWVDEEKIPTKIRKDVENLFRILKIRDEERINIEHIKGRVDNITEEAPTLEKRNEIQNILTFLIKNIRKYKENIGELASINWLPGKCLGEFDKEQWYSPEDLYHPKNAEIFYSQVAILDINEDLKNFEGCTTLCKALGIKFEPDMDILINHITYCAENDKSLDSQIYEMMRKLYTADKNEDKPYIKKLKEMACIYERNSKSYLEPHKFFWNPPNLLDYRHAAPITFGRSRKFFEAIGIREKPNIIDFAKIILEVSNSQNDLSNDEMILYFYCLEVISEEANGFAEYTYEVVEMLKDNPSILTINNAFTYPQQVFICKDDDIRNYFEGRIDGYIIKQEHNLDSTKKLLTKLGVEEIFNAFQEKGIFDKDEVKEIPDFNNKIRSESFLYVLSWALHHNGIEYESMLDCLREIRFYSVKSLKIQYKFIPTGENVEKESNVFFDGKDVYLNKEKTGDSWIHIFIAIFSKKLSNEDNIISNIAGAANRIMRDPDNELKDMKELGYEELDKEKPKLDYSVLTSPELDDSGEESQYEFDNDKNSSTVSQGSNAKSVDNAGIISGERKRRERQQQNFGNRIPQGSFSQAQPVRTQQNSSESKKQVTNGEKREGVKQDRIVSYANMTGDRSRLTDDDLNQEQRKEIDSAAMKAVIELLESEEFAVQRYEHYNKGFDLTATKGNEKRTIEVKGLYYGWTDKGVSLSQSQIEMAYKEKENFWLYVVEHAVESPKIYMLQNPFAYIGRFVFDDKYKKFAEE